MNRTCLVLICLCCAFCARSQVVAVKTNTLYDATTTLNLGVEVACNKHLSLDISGTVLGTSTMPAELVLHSTHEDEEALQTYAVHPLHLECGRLMKSVAESRQALDYEVEE